MPVAIQTAQLRQRVQSFDFKTLFIEDLGWNHFKGSLLSIPIEGNIYTLRPVAEKRGLVVFLCEPGADGALPDYATRGKIEKQVTRSVREHLIIYVDAARTRQTWLWVKHEPGKPDARREHPYHQGQSGEALAQRLRELAFTLEEEEQTGLLDVMQRVGKALDVEKVTKRFYDRFQKEHDAFLTFIQGIPEQEMGAWYASLMLNRLMFTYFIQKKGFLDNDTDYLPNRLKLVKEQLGPNRFHSFYRSFLLRLFHEGLGQPVAERLPEVEQLIGTVPYLNGGLFEAHLIEQTYPDIEIPDAAFARVFAFFDEYRWHLDERPLRNNDEINPDVLGYIFEKYINQKQMGAYYTKEDITGYISRNTILPYLFDAAQPECVIAFQPGGEVWRQLGEDPDRYLYDEVRKGVDLPLPAEIAAGLGDVSQRSGWNRPADAEYALPTETWREHVARRTRCLEVRAKLAAGEITSINDLITANLNIQQFAQDVIQNSEGAELLRAFWKAIRQVAVLDPTCGSGAFLFAALNILDPLYEACLERMQAFVEEADRSPDPNSARKFPDFREILLEVEKHPNRRYYILKSIIINNLYGVDIMEEAVEIARLRLFLKLVAQVEDVSKIEPLPDIDFNLRAGNTLIGYATYGQVKHAVTSKLDWDDTMGRIYQMASELDKQFEAFRVQQTAHGSKVEPVVKGELRRRLSELNEELDRYLATEYNVEPTHAAAFARWRKGHQPFHWFIEFYGIVHKRGGFDVIIGNPP